MSRVAITGVSTNGFIALQAVAADQRLHAASVIAACGDYQRFLRYSSMGMAGRPLTLDPDYASGSMRRRSSTTPVASSTPPC